jgi:fructose-1-phosphate kinase PfkB-like protein
MIVTITINPAVDRSTSLEKLIPEKKLRCTELIHKAGGGGIYVSKAIKLGVKPSLSSIGGSDKYLQEASDTSNAFQLFA